VAHYVVFAVGADRPGIVARLTGALYDVGANLLDSSMTILSGHFAVALALDAQIPVAALEAALADVAQRLDLGVTVREVDPAGVPPTGARHVVAVYGADHPGIVARVAHELATRGVNIVDLETRRVGDPDDPVYAMVLEVIVPPDLDVDELASDLRSVAEELGVEAHVHPVDADIL
jgi:glycine cleavage system transcriptional repressor